MAVYDSLDVGPRLVDLAVDETLEVERAAARVHRHAVEVVLHDVGRGHQLGRDGARHQIAARVAVVPRAHVPVAVEHTLVDQNAVGGYQVLDQGRIRRAG